VLGSVKACQGMHGMLVRAKGFLEVKDVMACEDATK